MAVESEQEVELNFSQYVHILSRRRWIVIGITFLSISAAAAYAFLTQPVYRAQTSINIERDTRSSVQSSAAAGGGEEQDEEYFATQHKLIVNETALRKVYTDLHLENTKDFAPGLGALANAVSVKPVPNTRLCNVVADSTEPMLAQKISLALSQNYVEHNLNNKLFMSKDVLEALEMSMTGADSQKIRESLPSVVNNKLIQDIKARIFEGEAQLADMRMEYKETHPAYIALASRLKQMREVLNNEVDNIVQSVKTELSGQLRGNNVRIIDMPNIPIRPVRPRKALALAFGVLAGLSSGVFLALLIEMLDQTVRTQDDVERRVGIPFLGIIPYARQKRDTAVYAPLLAQEVSLTSEAFRNLRTMVGFSDAVKGEPFVLVTSSVQEEGKSFVATNLAVVLSQLGQRVLIVDGDLRRPRLHSNMRVSKERGLSDYLSGYESDPAKLIQHGEVKNLDVIPCGPRPPNPAELLNSERLAQFISWARHRYTRVVIDCPPVFPISDVLLWGQHIRPVVFVTRFGRTRVPLIRTACARLRSGGLTILGGAINAARIGTMTYADGRYYEAYYRDYVDVEDRKTKRA